MRSQPSFLGHEVRRSRGLCRCSYLISNRNLWVSFSLLFTHPLYKIHLSCKGQPNKTYALCKASPKWECRVGTWDLLWPQFVLKHLGSESICESCKCMEFCSYLSDFALVLFNCLPCAHLTGIRKIWTNNKKKQPQIPPKTCSCYCQHLSFGNEGDSGSAHWIFSCLYGCQSGRWLKL